MAEAVKVIVRCRPLNDRENKLNCKTIVHIDEERGSCGISKPGAEHPPKHFTFDGAYFMDSTTEQIYNDIAYPLVEGVVEGYNGTVFAYGQTGCGKSYSMQGVDEPSTQRGIIPRAFQHIFESIEVAENTKYLVHASYLEIYNEEIRDLLSNDIKQKLELKEHPDRGVYVKELSMHPVSNVHECEKIMSSGWRNRSVGATLMNADSSRSHSIFTIYLEACDTGIDGGDHIRAGKLNLVDLAGSERQSKTGATGERLREATKINLSLSALGNVISALVDGKSKHIPYRDSKLTRLLQDSLGGNTKTLMVACLSPADNNYEETLSTLRYANRAKNIKNKPRINEDPKDALLREYQEEIQKLRSLLAGKLGPEGIKEFSKTSEPGAKDNLCEKLYEALLEGQSPPPRAKLPQQENGEVVIKEDTAASENMKNEYEQKLTDLKKQYEAEQMSKAKLQEDMNKLKSQYEQHIADMNKTQAAVPAKQNQQSTVQTGQSFESDTEYVSDTDTESESYSEHEQALEVIQPEPAEGELVGTDLVVFRQSANFMLKMSEMIYNHALELSFRKSVDNFPDNGGDETQKAITSEAAAGSTPDTGYYGSSNDQVSDSQSVGSGLAIEKPQIATYIGSERAIDEEYTEDGSEGLDDNINETTLVKQHEKALKRLQMLQQTMVGGEKARDEQAKEKLRERKRYSDKRRKQLEDASNNDDEEIILNVYDSIQDEVKARDKFIRKKNQELEAARMDIEDISYEFERDRSEYLATIRRQEKEIALAQAILDKLQPTIRRDCNYYNLDRIRGEAVWDEDQETWSLPELTIVKTSLPTAGFQKNGGLVSNDNSSSRAYPPQTSPMDSYMRNDVSPEEDKYLSKLRRNTSDDFASNYFKPKRQVQHIIASSREVPKGYRNGVSPGNGIPHASNTLSNGDRVSPKNYSNGPVQSHHNYNHNSSVTNLPSSTNYNISSPPAVFPRTSDPMSISLRPPHRLDAISPRGNNSRSKKKKKQSSRDFV